MQQENSTHPDLALLMQPDKRDIRCLVLAGHVPDALHVLRPFHCFTQDGYSALLFSAAQAGNDDCTRRIENLLHTCGLHAGLSGPFALAASAHGCMLKAHIALQTGLALAPERVLYPMDEFGEAALLRAAGAVLAQQGLAATDLCDASLLRIMVCDVQEGTQYADSLRAYLQHGLQLRTAAQALGIHRNTLAYRINRLGARFCLDFDDRNTCFELLFSFWLMQNLPAFPPPAASVPFDTAHAQSALWHCVQRQHAQQTPIPVFDTVLLAVGMGALSDAQRAALILALGALDTQAACAFDDDVLFFALPPDCAQPFLDACAPRCTPLCCPIAVSQPFPSTRLAQRAHLARLALRTATTPIIPMQSVGSTLFFTVLDRRISLAPYLCEDVIRIMDEDATRGSSLSQAFYAYLLNFRDMKRAAKQLGIHRNTMEYQLRKIDALIGGPIREPQRFRMMCTYKMLALPDTGVYDL